MARGVPHALLSLLLSTTMLVWSMSPPAVRHAHEGGSDLSHHHDAAHGTHDADGTHHNHDGGNRRSLTVVSDVIADETSHLHFHWLGFRLTLPGDDSPTKTGDEPNSSKLLVIRSGRTPLPQFHSGGRLDKLLTPLCLNAAARDIAAMCPAVVGSLLSVATQPLCDRARHERSGVLLA